MSPAGDDAQPWWSDGLRFTCTRCGRCCKGPEPGYVRIDGDEMAALCERLELTPSAFGKQYLRRLSDGTIALTEHPNGDCIFWEDGLGCSVYDVRPVQCRTFPFWPEVLATEADWDDYASDCPGMGHGRRYARKRIEAILAGAGETNRGRKRPPRRLKTAE